MTDNKISFSNWHPTNKYQGQYDFDQLIETNSDLTIFVKPAKSGKLSIDFANPLAVRTLNKTLLKQYYGIKDWALPIDFLCPAIPGRAEYIHRIADYLESKMSKGKQVRCLDIGTGASLIYPIIGICEYAWNFLGTDINQDALGSASKIMASNSILKGKLELRRQLKPSDIFTGVVTKQDYFDLSICNPPFHESREAAIKSNRRKQRNLHGTSLKKLNFGGTASELWFEGGELAFVSKMITESSRFTKQIKYFSCLVSKESNLKNLKRLILKHGAKYEQINMTFGNKQSRILVWTY